MLYKILTFDEEGRADDDSANFSEPSDKESQMDTYIVLFDFYDSFLDKIKYFQSLIPNDNVRLILVNLPGQYCTQFNPNKPNLVLNNAFYASCLDLLLYHLNERGIMNSIDSSQGGRYGLIGFGNGANIALFFSQMMLNDTTSTLKSLILLNPYNHFEKLVSTTMKQAIVGTKSGLQTNLLLDHMLHSVSESAELK